MLRATKQTQSEWDQFWFRSLYHLSVNYFPGIILVSFYITWERISIHNGTKIQRVFFCFVLFSICVPLCLDSSKEKNKWLLLRAKLAVTSTERIVKSWDGSRDISHFRTQICWLWVKGGESRSLVCAVNPDLNSAKTKQHQPLKSLFYVDYI